MSLFLHVDEPTPCSGKWALFDSTNRADHREAKALCEQCPVVASCAEHAKNVKRAAIRAENSITGTWSGRLYGHDGLPVRTLTTRARSSKPAGRPTNAELAARETSPEARALAARLAAVVAERAGVDRVDLFAKSQQHHLIRARRIAFLAARELGWSAAQIGRWAGGRQGETVLSGLARAEQCPDLVAVAAEVLASIGEQSAVA